MVSSKQSKPISRAEQLRQKRNVEAQKREQQMRQQSYRPIRPPVVVARNYSQTVPLYRSTAIKPRKSHYYKLHNSGAEVHVRSLPGIKINAKTLSAILVIAAFVMILYLSVSPSFKISSIELRGTQRVAALDVQASLDIANTPMISLDPAKMLFNLENAFPELANLKIKLVMPSKVIISGIERVPIIAWNSDKGTYWMDVEGIIFPPRGEILPPISIQADTNPPAAIMVFDSPELPDAISSYPHQIDPAVLNAIMLLSARMPQEGSFLYSQQDGLGWMDARGWNVYVGVDLYDLGTKMSAYEAIVKQLDQQGIRPVMVSVEHIDAPFFRTE